MCLTCVSAYVSNIKFVGISVFGVLIFFQASHCLAEIYKCMGPGGRVTIGDQPCAPSGADAAAAFEKSKAVFASTPAMRTPDKTDKEPSSTALALEEKILQMHSPECREFRIQLKRLSYLADASLVVHRPISVGDRSIWEHYQLKCLPQAGDIVALSLAQQDGAKRESSRKALCDRKAVEYERRKKMGSHLSEIEAQALAVLASEVARGCR